MALFDGDPTTGYAGGSRLDQECADSTYWASGIAEDAFPYFGDTRADYVLRYPSASPEDSSWSWGRHPHGKQRKVPHPFSSLKACSTLYSFIETQKGKNQGESWIFTILRVVLGIVLLILRLPFVLVLFALIGIVELASLLVQL